MQKRARQTYECPMCGKTFSRLPSQITADKPKCSKQCAYRAMKDLHGEHSPAWRGGRGTVNALGYVVHMVRGKLVAEHRVVMEKHLGRPLAKGEVIHHVNGDRSDNRIENLSLCKSHAEHVREHHGKRAQRRGNLS